VASRAMLTRASAAVLMFPLVAGIEAALYKRWAAWLMLAVLAYFVGLWFVARPLLRRSAGPSTASLKPHPNAARYAELAPVTQMVGTWAGIEAWTGMWLAASLAAIVSGLLAVWVPHRLRIAGGPRSAAERADSRRSW